MASNTTSGGTGEGCVPKDTSGAPVPASVFPLFDPQKRKEIMQKKTSNKSRKSSGRETTPISLSDTEATGAKPKKSRSKSTVTTATKGVKSKRRLKEDPDGDFEASKPLKAKKDPPRAIDTSTTLITPTSSPPALGGIGDTEDLIDPNQGRRKRRKKTPVPTQEEVDQTFLGQPPAGQEDTLSNNPGSFQGPVNKPLTIREPPHFSVEVPMRQLPPGLPKADAFKVLMKKKQEEEPAVVVVEDEEPILPSYSPEETSVEAPSGKRTPVTYDADTGILTIRSSPVLLPSNPPPGPIITLSLLGKQKRGKKKRKKEEVVEMFLPEEVATTAAERRTTTEFDPETGILTIRSSPILAPQSPGLRPKSAFSLLGKKKEPQPPPAAAIAQVSPQAALVQAPLPIVTVRQALKKVAVSEPKKTVHPFFQPGGLKKIPDATQPTQCDTEDLSITNSRVVPQPTQNQGSFINSNLVASSSGSLFSGSSGGLSPTTNRILKSPGLWDVPWPSKGNCHSRGLPASPVVTQALEADSKLPSKERKLKDRAVAVSGDEDLLLQYARKLSIWQAKQAVNALDYNERQYYDVPSDVRLPERIVTTGTQLQDMVRKQISTRLPHPNATSKAASGSSDDDAGPTTRRKIHPALTKLYTRLKHELTPFDKSECETSSWEVKYAPESSHEVLQIGKETQILKDWLMALKVESVGPSADKKSSKRKSRSSTPFGPGGKGGAANKKRKKKKDAELSDFIVNSDEERDEMNEVTDPEDNDGTPGPFGVKKSTIRAGDKGVGSPFGGSKEPGRLVNAVVISGPNGCGKTAAVYAVAKEAGFVVFEVSPGMRRNGKDIVDQVGEMSKTHLVHQAKTASAVSDGTSLFFKPKQVQGLQAEEEVAPKVTASQQQSLILLEEVDLLFEEDKQFWSSVLTLMAQSKRPIVFTCNDENLLPIDTLPLHAILRFTPPPKELVVDQLLLVCANEGHLLQRDSVESLVTAHNGDMRASLVELEFWCRMGLGDRKGGLDWMILRWPIGIDIEENGEKLRVVSKDTYIKGMGSFDRASMDEEAKWRSIWETWEVDVGGEDSGIGKLKELGEEATKRGMDKKIALRVCDEYAEAMSAVDVYAGGCMRGFDEMFMDSTQPLLSCKVRVDDTQGYPILQTDPLVREYSVGTEMAVSVRSLARRHLCGKRYQGFGEGELVDLIVQRSRIKEELKPLSQNYLSETFRSLSHTSTLFASTPAVCHSSVNGPPSVLVLDVAPYVRYIVRYNVRQEQERIRSSNLLSVGGRRPGRKRATKNSRVAEEGGDRSRKEKFPNINTRLVEGSGGVGWGELSVEQDGDGDSDGGGDGDGCEGEGEGEGDDEGQGGRECEGECEGEGEGRREGEGEGGSEGEDGEYELESE